MFKRKRKTRVEQAREDIEKQLRIVSKQATDVRKDLIGRMNATARDLRAEVFNTKEEKKEAETVAKDLEAMAHRLEKQAEQRFGEVSARARENLFFTMLAAVGLGVLLGVLFREMFD